MTELEIRASAVPSGRDMQASMDYARALATSGLLPESYRSQPQNVLYAIEYGRTLGITPMAAMTGVHVIKGKPTASAALISALVRRAGHKLRVRGDAQSATAQIIRSDDPEYVFEATFTMQDARNANLANKDTWKQFPGAMLKSRAITQVARDACEEVLFGLHYTAEELGADVDQDGAPVGDDWAQPAAAAEQIDEAEVVPEPEGITDAQQRALHSLITKKLGPQSDAARHGRMSAFTKREITSASQLTKVEASGIIDALTKRDDFVPPAPAPAPAPLSIQQTESPEAIAAAQSLLPGAEVALQQQIEDALLDSIQSAGDPDELERAWTRAQAMREAGSIGSADLDDLRGVYDLKRDELAQIAAEAAMQLAGVS